MADSDLYYVDDLTDGLLGRNVVWHDPANRSYPVRGVLFAEDAPIHSKTWKQREVTNQGFTSSCTAHSAAGLVRWHPFHRMTPSGTRKLYDTFDERVDLYEEAQRHDPWPGEDYEGSSTDAPFKVLRLRGHIKEWRWCFGLDDVLRTLTNHGPVGIGVNWTRDMMDTDANGFIHYTGGIIGGHAVKLLGIRIVPGVTIGESYVVGINSWGSWGFRNSGRFKLLIAELKQLLIDNGEALTIVA